MGWEKTAIVCICIYLGISLPLYALNQQLAKKCAPACEEAGCDIVISAAVSGEKIECRCLDSIIRQERLVTKDLAGVP